jgi:predicted dehydrogenase
MKSNYRIAVIGAGQLGSRHLQGLLRLDLPCEIHVVDPSAVSLDMARHRAGEVSAGASHSLHFHHQIEALPPLLDHSVIATASDVRLSVMRALLHGRTVHNILLEKVLFQRQSDFASAAELLHQAGSRAWVNCPRRVYPIYEKLRTFFLDDPLLHVDLRGGNWGLGCNSIHFIDIIAYLTGADVHSISTALLDDDLIDSKRAGFKEFTGTLLGRFGDASFSLTSQRDSQAPLLLTFRGGSRSCLVDESSGRAFWSDPGNSGWQVEEFKVPMLSELATGVTQRILEEGGSALTPYAQSAAYHLPLLQALGEHAARHLGGANDICPIT